MSNPGNTQYPRGGCDGSPLDIGHLRDWILDVAYGFSTRARTTYGTSIASRTTAYITSSRTMG